MAVLKMPLITQQQLRLHRILVNSSEDYLRECAKDDEAFLKSELRKGVMVEEGPLCADVIKGKFRMWERNGHHRGAA